MWRSRGLEPRPYCGCYDHLYIDINPPALTPSFPDYIPHRQLMAPFSDDGHAESATTPPLPEARPDAPLVYVTMGTVFTDVTVLQAVLAAMRDLDVRVVVTVGPRIDPTALGPQPTHVRVEQYVPQAALLPHSSLVISHGGSGTGLATLRHGLPQLCLPQGADQFLNAATITKAGAGLTLMPSGADEIAIADAVRRLLTDPSYRSAASVVADSIAAMPTPDDVAAVLEDICR